MVIIELIGSLCRDGADMPRVCGYIRPSEPANACVVSLFEHLRSSPIPAFLTQ